MSSPQPGAASVAPILSALCALALCLYGIAGYFGVPVHTGVVLVLAVGCLGLGEASDGR